MNLYGFQRSCITNFFEGESVSSVHVKPLMGALYKTLEPSSIFCTNLPNRIKKKISADYTMVIPELSVQQISTYDSSVKFGLQLSDGFEVETVLMPEKSRITICLSTQVGCQQGCVFCHTGKMGLKRNLEIHEIVGQVVFANRWINENPEWLSKLGLPTNQKVSNVVFMGMGEPCDNVRNVSGAIDLLQDPWGLAIGISKITVSTAGHLDGLKELMKNCPKVNFALSLHSTNSSERSKLMPINRRYPIEDVLSYLRKISFESKKSFLIQYTVIDKVNDDPKAAESLAKMLSDISCKVNLIPLNPIDPSRLNSPSPKRLIEFRDVLHNLGVRVMIRYSKGQDIDAACGQLVKSK
jgi:23S rRNA (adenine2503-C2)-methyltransferase